jgi:TctA family transporter
MNRWVEVRARHAGRSCVGIALMIGRASYSFAISLFHVFFLLSLFFFFSSFLRFVLEEGYICLELCFIGMDQVSGTEHTFGARKDS